jgi:hypothetical protein
LAKSLAASLGTSPMRRSLAGDGPFSTCGAVGIVYALPLFFLLKNPPRLTNVPEPTRPGAAIKELLGNRNFILLVLYFTLPAIAGWVMRDWMPDISETEVRSRPGAAV